MLRPEEVKGLMGKPITEMAIHSLVGTLDVFTTHKYLLACSNEANKDEKIARKGQEIAAIQKEICDRFARLEKENNDLRKSQNPS